MTMLPASSASRSRCVSIFLMRALRCVLSVTMPICAPVKLTAFSPSSWMAMAVRAMEICSPVARSMSISRADGVLGDLGGLGDQLVGGVAVGDDDDDDLVAGLLGADGLAGRLHDPLGVLDTRPAELLHHETHGEVSGCRHMMELRLL